MKSLIFTAIFCGAMGIVCAQNTTRDTIKTDSAKTKKHIRIKVTTDADTTATITAGKKKYVYVAKAAKPGFTFGLTFTNFHLGFATLIDNGSFTLSPQNQFLDYRQIKTSNVGFDLIKIGYRFNDHFKVTLDGGFDWTLIRLKQNINIVPDQPTLQYVTSTVNYSKNRFSSNYFVMPLAFDIMSSQSESGRRAHLVLGPEAGFLIDGMQKQISSEYGKTKNFNDFHFTRFEYGAFARFLYGSDGIYFKYYFNDMFENSPAQKGLKSFSFGLVLGF